MSPTLLLRKETAKAPPRASEQMEIRHKRCISAATLVRQNSRGAMCTSCGWGLFWRLQGLGPIECGAMQKHKNLVSDPTPID